MEFSDEKMRRLIADEGAAVYRTAVSVTRNAADAEDIYQEVFLRVIRFSPVWEIEAHRHAWFLRVTVNCGTDHLKSARRRQTLPLTEPAAPAPEPRSNDALEEALGTLSPRERALIHLFYYEEYRTEEIARITGMNHATVRSALKRAREKLRKRLEGTAND